jgi:hypothetical protein
VFIAFRNRNDGFLQPIYDILPRLVNLEKLEVSVVENKESVTFEVSFLLACAPTGLRSLVLKGATVEQSSLGQALMRLQGLEEVHLANLEMTWASSGEPRRWRSFEGFEQASKDGLHFGNRPLRVLPLGTLTRRWLIGEQRRSRNPGDRGRRPFQHFATVRLHRRLSESPTQRPSTDPCSPKDKLNDLVGHVQEITRLYRAVHFACLKFFGRNA